MSLAPLADLARSAPGLARSVPGLARSVPGLARSVPGWLGDDQAPGYECAFCGLRYDAAREHCAACGFPVQRGR